MQPGRKAHRHEHDDRPSLIHRVTGTLIRFHGDSGRKASVIGSVIRFHGESGAEGSPAQDYLGGIVADTHLRPWPRANAGFLRTVPLDFAAAGRRRTTGAGASSPATGEAAAGASSSATSAEAGTTSQLNELGLSVLVGGNDSGPGSDPYPTTSRLGESDSSTSRLTYGIGTGK